MGLPDLKAKKKGKQKVAGGSHVTEALDKLREQTREAVRGLESMSPQPGVDDFSKDPMMEDWVKQFEELAGGQVLCFLLSYECQVNVFVLNLKLTLLTVWMSLYGACTVSGLRIVIETQLCLSLIIFEADMVFKTKIGV